jgi:hypothetical protein
VDAVPVVACLEASAKARLLLSHPPVGVGHDWAVRRHAAGRTELGRGLQALGNAARERKVGAMSPFDWQFSFLGVHVGWTSSWRGLRMGPGWRNIGPLWWFVRPTREGK